MIELNLLPENMRVAKKKQKKPALKFDLSKLPMLPLLIGAGSVILLFHIIIGIMAFSLNLRYTNLNNSLSHLSSQEQEAVSLKSEVDMLGKKLTVIDELSSTSLVWSKKLYDLNQSVTEGIWLASLYLDQRQPDSKEAILPSSLRNAGTNGPVPRQLLVLRGSAFSATPAGETAVIGRFIESLKNSRDFFEDFEKIELSSTQRSRLGETEIMDFVIECYFKPERRYFDKLKAGI